MKSNGARTRTNIPYRFTDTKGYFFNQFQRRLSMPFTLIMSAASLVVCIGNGFMIVLLIFGIHYFPMNAKNQRAG